MENLLKLIGFMAAFGLVMVAMWNLTLMWRDPREETDGEKRRREEREKKEASKPK